MKKREVMKCFSGSTFQRLPLYKVAMGGVAVLLCASIGVSVMASAFLSAAPEQAAPTAGPTLETAAATPTPTPSPTPTPAQDVLCDVSVVQQDIGVQLYTLACGLGRKRRDGGCLRCRGQQGRFRQCVRGTDQDPSDRCRHGCHRH